MATAPARGTLAVVLPGVGFVALGLGLGVALISFSQTVYRIQGGVSAIAISLPLGYAFAAGMVATVNPCGVLLLPSLVAYYLGSERPEDVPPAQRATRALLLGMMATLGFVAVFGVVGGVIALGGRAIAAYFPVGGLLVGLALLAIGALLALTGRSLGLATASRAMEGADPRGGVGSLFLFGVSYGVASLACTLPVFLVVAGAALAAGSLFDAAGQFLSYALGMGTVLTLVVLGAAFARATVARTVRRVVPFVHRLAASLLLGAGVFVTWYWLSALTLL